MEKQSKPLRVLWALLLTAVLAAVNVACTSNDDSEVSNMPVVPDHVDNPVRAIRYEQSDQFKSDLECVNQLACVLRSMTWNYFLMASDGLKRPEDFFTVKPEELGISQPKLADEYLEMFSYLYNNCEKYELALQNLEANGILEPQVYSRGIIPVADGIGFGLQCKTGANMGRMAVMSILRAGGWTTDGDMLKRLYEQIPKENRRGYSDPVSFWQDFSSGKLDDRSNQIFKQLYSVNSDDKALRFRDLCDDIGISPSSNMAVITQKMAQSGMNLILDACPINLGTGVDIYNSANVTHNVLTNTFKFKANDDGTVSYDGVNTEAWKDFFQQWGHNTVKYGRDFEKLMDKVESGFKRVNYTNWSANKDWWIENVFQDLYEFTANDLYFSNNVKEAFNDHGKKFGLETKLVVKEVNGKEVTFVYLYDPLTGKIRIGFIQDQDGNIVLYPGEKPATKTIVAVNRQTGKRVTKKVPVEKDKENNVEVDLEYDEKLLEEEPQNGELSLYPGNTLLDEKGEGGSNRFTIVTNYLYYKCQTSDNWIKATIPTDANFLYVQLTKNDHPKDPTDVNGKPEERKGHVLVMATNKEGKVLKTVTLTVTQKPYQPVNDSYIIATPPALEFSADGGSLSSVITHSWAYPYTAIDCDDELDRWADIQTSETAQGTFKLTVTAQPNTSPEDRSGIITVYAAYNEKLRDDALNGKVDKNNVLTTNILVKQSPQQDESKRLPVKEVFFYIEGSFSYWDEEHKKESTTINTSNATMTDKENATITSQEVGNNLHVQCIGKDYRGEDATLSFDIVDWKNWDSSNLKITNVKYKVSGKYSVNAQLTNLPVTEAGIEYLESNASIKDGVNFIAFDYKDNGPTYQFTFSPDSKVQITINFRQEYWHW